ncbi:MAG: hypothetical protein ACLSUW_08310 [Akkermansia sp.]
MKRQTVRTLKHVQRWNERKPSDLKQAVVYLRDWADDVVGRALRIFAGVPQRC